MLWFNSRVLEIIQFTAPSLYQKVSEKRQGADFMFAISALDHNLSQSFDKRIIHQKSHELFLTLAVLQNRHTMSEGFCA
jgi:hypothetical protein